jgi:hypothetical protein
MAAPAPLDPNLVIITNAQMFNELRDLTTGQNRVEGKIDSIAHTQEVTASDHEKRLRSLEANRWPLPAVCALLALISCITTVVSLTHGR